MAFHHVALATRDVEANHEFYTEAMGFKLVKAEIGQMGDGGFAKHLFYETGEGEMIAFWDLHDESLPDDWNPAIATGLGLPPWTNHIAFAAVDLTDLEARKKRWLEHGVDVVEIDHDWCYSIYATDPNGILVEFCVTTAEMTEEDAAEALRVLADPAPSVGGPPPIQVHRASEYRGD